MAFNKNSLKLTKQQLQMVVAGVVILAVLGYVYIWFFWIPISQRSNDAASQMDDVEAKIDKTKAEAARLPRLQAQLKALSDEEAEAERRLPKDRAVPEILVAIGEMAQDYGVELISFSPGSTSNKQFFVELSYPVVVEGGFHNIGKFLAAVALQERIFNVQNVNYGEEQTEKGMRVTFTLISYQYKG